MKEFLQDVGYYVISVYLSRCSILWTWISITFMVLVNFILLLIGIIFDIKPLIVICMIIVAMSIVDRSFVLLYGNKFMIEFQDNVEEMYEFNKDFERYKKEVELREES